MKNIFGTIFCVFFVFSVVAQSEAIHYDINPKYPHYTTAEERLLIPTLSHNARSSQYPTAPVSAVAEFQPMSGVLISYPLGVPVSLVRELSKITKVKVLINPSADSLQIKNFFNYSQVSTGNVDFWTIEHDSYWVRDYGPWFVIDGNDSVGVIDFIYNRPTRPNDNVALEYIAEELGVSRYEMPITHTGGNYMVDGYGTAASTMLVEQENPDYSDDELQDIAFNYLGVDNYMFLPDPLGEYIAHIDCWGKFLDVDKVIIGKVPVSDPRYQNYEEVAETFAQSITPWGNNYQVFRVYANPDSYYATPYTNSLIVNDHVFVPITGNSHDNEAIAVYQNAMPGYTIVPIMSSNYTPWKSTDALHCRTHELADQQMLYIKHFPLLGAKSLNDNLTIEATIKPLSGSLLVTDSVLVFYQINSEGWQSASLENAGDAIFTFDFSSLNLTDGDEVKYYVSAKDESGRREKHPYIGAADPHIFSIGNVAINDKVISDIQVFPNPVVSTLYITSSENRGIKSVELFDSEGRKCNCRTAIFQNRAAIDVQNLAKGVYFVLITDGNGTKYHRKVVK